ncbi:MAG: D-alanyl-D-alanine carboxypeptidase family protein [Tissierellia bacterium]|nr:D-alanyl-D-alanine carboxypeptidase family protein [Tissierellia bacterium]
MKKSIAIVLVIILIFSFPIYGTQEAPTTVVGEEPVKEEEIRDQDLLVPTKNGVQNATLKEVELVNKLEEKTLEELTNSYVIGDYVTGQILEEYEADKVVALASTSKLVSAFVVLDKLADGTIHLDDKVVIDKEVSSLIGSTYKLKENDVKTVKELLYATLIISGNDAITALGKHIAGSTEGFVAMMNEKCKDLGLEHAHMINPHGLTNYMIEDYNKMTTRELFQLSVALIKEHPEVLNITKQRELSEPERQFLAYNTNPILGILPQIDGLKTGYTNAAGRCLVATGVKQGIPGVTEDIRLLGITMGSSGDWARFVAAKRLMNQGFQKYSLRSIARKDQGVGELTVEHGSPKSQPVYPQEDHNILWDGEKVIKKEVKLNDITPPIEKGAVVGSVHYTLDGEEVWATNVVIKEDIKQLNVFIRLKTLLFDIFQEMEGYQGI